MERVASCGGLLTQMRTPIQFQSSPYAIQKLLIGRFRSSAPAPELNTGYSLLFKAVYEVPVGPAITLRNYRSYLLKNIKAQALPSRFSGLKIRANRSDIAEHGNDRMEPLTPKSEIRKAFVQFLFLRRLCMDKTDPSQNIWTALL